MTRTILLATALSGFALSASAQTCVERGAATEALKRDGAEIASQGIANGYPLQVWRRPDGQWVMVVDNGVALCLWANGQDWETFPTGERT